MDAEENEKEIDRLNQLVDELSSDLKRGRHYLMSVSADEITVEDTLEAFGFGRNGLG